MKIPNNITSSVIIPIIAMILLFPSMPLMARLSDYSPDLSDHKGRYVYIMLGMMQATHDKNVRTGTPMSFSGPYEFSYGITYGRNLTERIAPEIQIAYATSTGQTPSGSAREHLVTTRVNGKYSFMTGASMNENAAFRIYPYAKLGGLAHVLYINAPIYEDTVLSWGGGFDVGGGIEMNMNIFYLGLDLSNDIIFLKEQRKLDSTVGGIRQILRGGMKNQMSAMLAAGFHF